jgi:hypothetical protein
MDSHAHKVERLFYRREVRRADGPGLFGLQAKSGDDLISITRNDVRENLGRATLRSTPRSVEVEDQWPCP